MQQYEVPLRTTTYASEQQDIQLEATGSACFSTLSALEHEAVLRAITSQTAWVTPSPSLEIHISISFEQGVRASPSLVHLKEQLFDALQASELWQYLELDVELQSEEVHETPIDVAQLQVTVKTRQKQKQRPVRKYARFPLSLENDDSNVNLPTTVPAFTLQAVKVSATFKSAPELPRGLATEGSAGLLDRKQGSKDHLHAHPPAFEDSPQSTGRCMYNAEQPSSPTSVSQSSGANDSLFETTCFSQRTTQSSSASSRCNSFNKPNAVTGPGRALCASSCISLLDCALRELFFGDLRCPRELARTASYSSGLTLHAISPYTFVADVTPKLSRQSRFVTMASEGIATILANSTSPELQAKAERLRALFEDNAVPERSPKHFRPEKVEMKLALKHLLWTTLHRNAWCSGAKRPPWPILKVTSNHSSKECPSPLLIMSENLHATSDFLDDLFSDRPKNNPSTHTNWKGGAPQGLSTLVCDDIQTDDICLVRSSSPTLKTAELLDRSSPPPLTHPDLDPLRVSSPLLKITDGRSDATSERASSPPMSGEQLQRITLFEESSLFLENDEEEEEEKGCDDMIDVVTCLDDEETVGGKADILDRSSSPIRLDDDDDLCQELPTSQSLWHM